MAAKKARFEISQDKKKQWRYTLKAKNGEKVFQSEGYSTQVAVFKAINRLVDLVIEAECELGRDG